MITGRGGWSGKISLSSWIMLCVERASVSSSYSVAHTPGGSAQPRSSMPAWLWNLARAISDGSSSSTRGGAYKPGCHKLPWLV